MNALAKVNVTQRTVVDRIVRVYLRATEDEILAGKCWYYEAGLFAEEIACAGSVTIEQAAVAIAHLSPMASWDENRKYALDLVASGDAGTFKSNVRKALTAMSADDPWNTFAAMAKTYNFAKNILGDQDAVTVDRWAARVAGIDVGKLALVGVYDAVAHCYKLAAKRVGVSPAQIQAITWVVVRGSAF